MRIVEYKKIEKKIKLITGLHIGGNKEDIEIGGLDNPVIKTPINEQPYIPGSSLKGKLRCLLEQTQPLGLDKIIMLDVKEQNDRKRKLHDHIGENTPETCPICRIFGMETKDINEYGKDVGIPRLIVRDAFICSKPDEYIVTEEKWENRIDRCAGKAISPRSIERVVPGIKFKLEMVLKIFDIDEQIEKYCGHPLMDYIEEALKLLELDALGGSGSRGCGKVEILDIA